MGVICCCLRKYKVKTRNFSHYRRYHPDHNYFDCIDTEYKAYFLGLLFADGCVMLKGNTGIVHLGLEKNDRYMVKLFKNAVYPHGGGKIGINDNQRRIVVYSNHMFNSLVKLGCTQRKSLTLRFPTPDKVPDHLMHHFIRGYFDGDGCIFWKRDGFSVRGGVCIVSSIPFCKVLCKKLNLLVGIFHFFILSDSPRTGGVRASRKEVLKNFYQYAYKDPTIFLKRKRIKFDNLMKYIQ